MDHYICTGGCGGVADTPGVCHDMNCPKHGQPLTKEEYDEREVGHHHERILPTPLKLDFENKSAE
jgi:hypothetical protein